MLTLLTNLPKETLVQQIKDGGILMLLGMGTVFLFLVILIFATKLMSRIVGKYAPATSTPKSTGKPSGPAPKAAPKTDDAAIAAAIAAAYDKAN